MFLQLENKKVGHDVWTWSIPAVQSCPGSSALCRGLCYARRHTFRFPSVKSRHAANLKLARRDDFWMMMVAAIRYHEVKTLRVHSAGDFFSPAYVRHWIKIAKLCPEVTMWTYTRSWRLAKFSRDIAKLAALPNFTLYWSCDQETGLPGNLPPRARVAYLQTAADDIPSRPVDLIFRTHSLRKKKARQVATPEKPSPVCPAENGLVGASEVHCSSCQTCFTTQSSQSRDQRLSLPLLAG